MNDNSTICLTPGPLFITRKGKTTVLFHGGHQRWHTKKLGEVQFPWKPSWQIDTHGKLLEEEVSGKLASEKKTFLAFRGATGDLSTGKEHAHMSVCRTKAASYELRINATTKNWDVVLNAQRTRDHDLRVEIKCSGVPIISAPSHYETWTEGVCSIGGFVRHKWGDWLVEDSGTLPSFAAVACLYCVGFHNSAIGDLLVSDTPV